jgi:ferredoxin
MPGSLRVKVDLERCVGHGRCYEIAPEVFGDDERGYCVLLRPEVPPAQAEAVRRAEANCPEQAISVTAESD